MHEWALAEAVVSTISRIASEKGLGEVIEVTIRIGELQQIDLDAFKFALEQLSSQYSIRAKFEFREERAEFRCRVCGETWPFKKEDLGPDISEAIHVIPEVAHAFLRCPRCGSPDFEVVRGRGIWIESIRGGG
ncbi:MAG: hydrogenase nickel incorporation protein HypA [Aigarchaeota archaeon]|nr:hydrogenase nickel incorporation protein HypA [Candidatus Wolframiiraptor gerlachensis]